MLIHKHNSGRMFASGFRTNLGDANLQHQLGFRPKLRAKAQANQARCVQKPDQEEEDEEGLGNNKMGRGNWKEIELLFVWYSGRSVAFSLDKTSPCYIGLIWCVRCHETEIEY